MTARQIAGYALVGGLALVIALAVVCIPLETVRWWRQVRARRLSLDEHVDRGLAPSNVRVLHGDERRRSW